MTTPTCQKNGRNCNNPIPQRNDVVFGRGGFGNHHEGNEWYRKRVAIHKESYQTMSMTEKTRLSLRIVKDVRGRDPPGRFLMKDPSTGLWRVVDVKAARQKVSQALRERPKQKRSARLLCLCRPTIVDVPSDDSTDVLSKKCQAAGVAMETAAAAAAAAAAAEPNNYFLNPIRKDDNAGHYESPAYENWKDYGMDDEKVKAGIIIHEKNLSVGSVCERESDFTMDFDSSSAAALPKPHYLIAAASSCSEDAFPESSDGAVVCPMRNNTDAVFDEDDDDDDDDGGGGGGGSGDYNMMALLYDDIRSLGFDTGELAEDNVLLPLLLQGTSSNAPKPIDTTTLSSNTIVATKQLIRGKSPTTFMDATIQRHEAATAEVATAEAAAAAKAAAAA